VINYSGAGLAAQEVPLTRHFGESRDGDHGVRMTSLVIVVICSFE
jgi:hypothetical protein